MKRILTLLLFLLSIPILANATDYYVRTDGHDTASGLNNTNNETTGAWLTIQHAADTIVAGDTVYVQAGTYAEYPATVNSGSAGNLITYQAVGTVYIQRFDVTDDYIKLDGFNFNAVQASTPQFDEPGAFVTVSGDYCTISNNIITTVVSWWVKTPFGVNNSGGSNNLITLNNIGPCGYGVQVSNNSASVTISYNTIHELDTDSFRINDHSGPVNIIYNEVYTLYEKGQHTDFIQTFTDFGGHDVLIEGNYYHDSEGSMGMIWGGDPDTTAYPPYNWTWRNNIFSNITGPAGQYTIGNLDIFNNVYWNVGGGSAYAFSVCSPVDSENCAPAADIENNFFLNHGTGAGSDCGIGYNKCGEITADYNYYAQGPDASWAAVQNVSEAHEINGGNPLFVDYANDNFRLTATSPAKDAGVTIASFSTDILGTTRPKDTAWDIGPYEYDSGLTTGTVAWGHETGVTEANVRGFSGNWTGTGTVVGSGDSEHLRLYPGQYMESEVIATQVGRKVKLRQNKYAAADTGTMKYRQGATQAACEAAEWSTYIGPFVSLGYVQIRIEAP